MMTPSIKRTTENVKHRCSHVTVLLHNRAMAILPVYKVGQLELYGLQDTIF